MLSESSSDSEAGAGGEASRGPKKAKIVERLTDRKLSLKVERVPDQTCSLHI